MGLIAEILLKKKRTEQERDQLLSANSQLVEKVDTLEKQLASPDVIVLDDDDRAALAAEERP